MMKEIPSEFYEKRKEGENDNYLCELMRKDDVKEFGAYANRQNTSLNDNIEQSIYETNQFFLFQNGLSLSTTKFKFEFIEYAAFFGIRLIL
ncbi:hypothetical protein M9Y10_033181 [Tritrichomonas musculus]|uniref:Uncharacterized protein n=1 Tax=Tritrichomonas musculus TaxID=1915356 RepID=A0ABR2GY45_9EUKA